MYSYFFKDFLKVEAADVRPLLPVNLNEVGNKSLFRTLLELKKVPNSKNLVEILIKKLN